jgi:hypothetical protein
VGTEELTSVLDEAGASYELLPHAHTEAATAACAPIPGHQLMSRLINTTSRQ